MAPGAEHHVIYRALADFDALYKEVALAKAAIASLKSDADRLGVRAKDLRNTLGPVGNADAERRKEQTHQQQLNRLRDADRRAEEAHQLKAARDAAVAGAAKKRADKSARAAIERADEDAEARRDQDRLRTNSDNRRRNRISRAAIERADEDAEARRERLRLIANSDLRRRNRESAAKIQRQDDDASAARSRRESESRAAVSRRDAESQARTNRADADADNRRTNARLVNEARIRSEDQKTAGQRARNTAEAIAAQERLNNLQLAGAHTAVRTAEQVAAANRRDRAANRQHTNALAQDAQRLLILNHRVTSAQTAAAAAQLRYEQQQNRLAEATARRTETHYRRQGIISNLSLATLRGFYIAGQRARGASPAGPGPGGPGSGPPPDFFSPLEAAGERFERRLKSVSRWLISYRGLILSLVLVIGPLVSVLGALGAAFIAVGNVIGSVAGSLLALPGLFAAVAVAMTAVIVAVKPMVDVFQAYQAAQKATSAGTREMGEIQQQTADRVRNAARSYVSASNGYRSAVDDDRRSQERLNKARRDAVRDLEDLRLQLERASFDETGAILALREAQLEYQKALNAPGTTGIDREQAALRVRDAELSLREVRVRNVRLAQDAAETERKGVEQSDQVVDARRAAADATTAVTEAALRLTDAEKDLQRARAEQAAGGVTALKAQEAYQDALDKLGPKTRAVAKAFFDPGGLLDGLRRLQKSTSEELFGPLLDKLGKVRSLVPAAAAVLNGAAAAVGKVAANAIDMVAAWPASDWNKIVETNGRVIGALGQAVLFLTQGLKDVALAAAPFTEWIAAALAAVADDFASWGARARGSGDLAEYLDDTKRRLQDLGVIVRNIASWFSSLYTASKEFTTWFLDRTKAMTAGWAEWGQAAEQSNSGMRRGLEAMKPLLGSVRQFLSEVADAFLAIASDPANIKEAREILRVLGQVILPQVVRFFTELSEAGVISSVLEAIATVLDAFNDVIERTGALPLHAIAFAISTVAAAIGGLFSLPGVGHALAGIVTFFAVLGTVTAVGRFLGLFAVVREMRWLFRNWGNLRQFYGQRMQSTIFGAGPNAPDGVLGSTGPAVTAMTTAAGQLTGSALALTQAANALLLAARALIAAASGRTASVVASTAPTAVVPANARTLPIVSSTPTGPIAVPVAPAGYTRAPSGLLVPGSTAGYTRAPSGLIVPTTGLTAPTTPAGYTRSPSGLIVPGAVSGAVRTPSGLIVPAPAGYTRTSSGLILPGTYTPPTTTPVTPVVPANARLLPLAPVNSPLGANIPASVAAPAAPATPAVAGSAAAVGGGLLRGAAGLLGAVAIPLAVIGAIATAMSLWQEREANRQAKKARDNAQRTWALELTETAAAPGSGARTGVEQSLVSHGTLDRAAAVGFDRQRTTRAFTTGGSALAGLSQQVTAGRFADEMWLRTHPEIQNPFTHGKRSWWDNLWEEPEKKASRGKDAPEYSAAEVAEYKRVMQRREQWKLLEDDIRKAQEAEEKYYRQKELALTTVWGPEIAAAEVQAERFRRATYATERFTDQQIALTEALARFGSVTSTAAEKAQALGEAYDLVYGSASRLFEQDLAYRDGLDSLKVSTEGWTKAQIDARRNMDLNTAEGREAARTVKQQIDLSREQLKAEIEASDGSTEAVEKATASHKKRLGQIQDTGREAGISAQATQGLIDRFGQLPTDVSTAFTETGAAEVDAKFAEILRKAAFLINNGFLPQATDITPTNPITFVPAKPATGGGGSRNNQARASGGQLVGPGTGTSDDILLWGSNGEFMQPTAAVNYYGLDFMEALRFRKIPRQVIDGMLAATELYANGGVVRPNRQSPGVLPDDIAAARPGSQRRGVGRSDINLLLSRIGTAAIGKGVFETARKRAIERHPGNRAALEKLTGFAGGGLVGTPRMDPSMFYAGLSAATVGAAMPVSGAVPGAGGGVTAVTNAGLSIGSIVINNPEPEPAGESMYRTIRKLAFEYDR